MLRIIYLFIFFFLCFFAKAQNKTDSLKLKQYRLLEKTSLLKNDSVKLKIIDSVLSSGEITYDKYIAGFYSLRAEVISEMYTVQLSDYTLYVYEESDTIKLDSSIFKIINSIVNDYTKAIEACVFCSPIYKIKRMDFYSSIGNDSLYNKDLEDVKKSGFKPENTYVATLGINYMKGKNDWLEFEISASTLFQRGYFLKSIDPTDGKRKKVDSYSWPVGASFLTLGYNQNLNIKAHEYTASLLRVTAPVLISITKFGALQSPTEKHLLWFYRPEIGIGNSFISIGYGYNFIFKKSERNKWEKHLLVLKLIIPTIKL